MNPDQGSPAEPNARPTPASPAELAAMQRDDEVCMLQGLDLSTKARAIYLFAEELQISTQEAIDLAYAFVRYAEGSLDYWVQQELAQNRPNTGAACTWASWRGGLTGVRLTLRGMVETPVDPELWTRAPGSSST